MSSLEESNPRRLFRSGAGSGRAVGTSFCGKRLKVSDLRVAHQIWHTARARLYPLTAPTVKPAMNRSTKKLYRMAMGALAMKHAAISEPQK